MDNKDCFTAKNYADLDLEFEDREGLIYMKQAVLKYQTISNNADEELNKFLLSENFYPYDKSMQEIDGLISLFDNNIKVSGKTITNLTEAFFELGEFYLKESGFWMKIGLKDRENPNLARHLVICALIYSQLGQTLIAEGMYRQSLEYLNKVFYFDLL